jgi:UvrD/REP helicase N-terminal domain
MRWRLTSLPVIGHRGHPVYRAIRHCVLVSPATIHSPMELLQDLNPAQREAATHDDRPLLIVVGASTGKTTAITRRIAWLIAEKLARPAEILALKLMKKAQRI